MTVITLSSEEITIRKMLQTGELIPATKRLEEIAKNSKSLPEWHTSLTQKINQTWALEVATQITSTAPPKDAKILYHTEEACIKHTIDFPSKLELLRVKIYETGYDLQTDITMQVLNQANTFKDFQSINDEIKWCYRFADKLQLEHIPEITNIQRNLFHKYEGILIHKLKKEDPNSIEFLSRMMTYRELSRKIEQDPSDAFLKLEKTYLENLTNPEHFEFYTTSLKQKTD